MSRLSHWFLLRRCPILNEALLQNNIQKHVYCLKYQTLVTSSKKVKDKDAPKTQRQETVLVDFDDYGKAFRTKTLGDLIRTLFVMRLCSFKLLVNNSIAVMNSLRRIFGDTLVIPIIRSTIYKQFVGGAEKHNISIPVQKANAIGLGVMFAVPIEEESKDVANNKDSWYDESLNVILQSLKLAWDLSSDTPMIQMRPSAVVPKDILVKLSNEYPSSTKRVGAIDAIHKALADGSQVVFDCLTREENTQLNLSLKRLLSIAETAKHFDVLVWVDAEYSFINPAEDIIVMAMALRYNQSAPLIGFTYQAYLKTTLSTLVDDMNFLQSRNCKFMAKLVRGAYMVKERQFAETSGYACPIHDTWEATNDCYRACTDAILTEISRDPQNTAVIFATHNEKSVIHAINQMNLMNLENSQIFFGQLYGMCDHVSYSLAHGGYKVFKSVPYGDIDQTVPYLSRRAQENQAVLSGIRRERRLVWKALFHKISGIST